MSTSLAKPSEGGSLQELIKQPKYASRFAELFRDRAPQFASSLIQVGNSLPGVEPTSIITAAMTATAMDLPIDRNLGFAWIVPYKSGDRKLAQFQMGWKGYVQLALRTNQYRVINSIEVYEGELVSFDRLTGKLVLDPASKSSDTVVGYAAYMELVSGFQHTEYWSIAEVRAHAQRYSQSFRGGYDSPWKTNFDEMAMKTVLVSMIRRWGPMSISTQRAYQHDGGVVVDIDSDVIYPDSAAAPTQPAAPAASKPRAVRKDPQVTQPPKAATQAPTDAQKQADPEPDPEPQGDPEPEPEPTKPVEPAKSAPKKTTPPPPPEESQADHQADKLAFIRELSIEGKVVSVKQLAEWTKSSGRDERYGLGDVTTWSSWDDVPAEYASILFRSPKTIQNLRLIYVMD